MNKIRRAGFIGFFTIIALTSNENLLSTSPRFSWGGTFDVSTDNSIIAADESLLVTATVSSFKRDTVFVGLDSHQPFESIGDSIVRILLDSGISASVSFLVKLRLENAPVGEIQQRLALGASRFDPRKTKYFAESKLLAYSETKHVYIVIRDPDDVPEETPIVWRKLAVIEAPLYEITFHKSGVWFGSGRDALYKSTTQGRSWKITSPQAHNRDLLPFPQVECLPSGVIMLLTKDGVMRSTDIGESWRQVSISKEWEGGRGFFSASNGSLFVLGSTYKSTDIGLTWKKSDQGIEHISSTTMIEPSPGKLFVVGYPQPVYVVKNPNSGIYVSDDFGKSWKPTSIKNTVIESIACSGSSVYACSRNGAIYKSSDFGELWEVVTPPSIVHMRIHVKLVVGAPGKLFSWGYKEGIDTGDRSIDSGIFSCSLDSGKSWAYSTYGLPRRRELSSLVVDPDGHLLTTTESGDLYRTVDAFTSKSK